MGRCKLQGTRTSGEPLRAQWWTFGCINAGYFLTGWAIVKFSKHTAALIEGLVNIKQDFWGHFKARPDYSCLGSCSCSVWWVCINVNSFTSPSQAQAPGVLPRPLRVRIFVLPKRCLYGTKPATVTAVITTRAVWTNLYTCFHISHISSEFRRLLISAYSYIYNSLQMLIKSANSNSISV